MQEPWVKGVLFYFLICDLPPPLSSPFCLGLSPQNLHTFWWRYRSGWYEALASSCKCSHLDQHRPRDDDIFSGPLQVQMLQGKMYKINNVMTKEGLHPAVSKQLLFLSQGRGWSTLSMPSVLFAAVNAWKYVTIFALQTLTCKEWGKQKNEGKKFVETY